MESDFHKLMKDSVSHELAVEGYNMHLEPFDPPLERLSWNCFRPDILGVKNGESKLADETEHRGIKASFWATLDVSISHSGEAVSSLA